MNSAVRSTLGLLLLSLTVASVASPNLAAQGRGKGGGKSEPQSQTSVTVVFRDSDRVAFRDYFVAHRIVAEPLPPGIAKNVARGKPLPPGIAKRSLPVELVRVAPRVADVSYAIVGEVVVAVRSGVVIDVMAGVFK